MTNRDHSITFTRIVRLVGGLWVLVASTTGLAQNEDPKIAPRVESILRRTAEFYKKATSVAVDVERVGQAGGQTSRDTFMVAFQRPNRFAIRPSQVEQAVTLLCDGKVLVISIPFFQNKNYIEDKAPSSLDEIELSPVLRNYYRGMILSKLCTSDPYSSLMNGVRTARDLGDEQVDSVSVHHLALTHDQFDCEVWVAAKGDPVIIRVVLDRSKELASKPGVKPPKKFGEAQTYKNWRIDHDVVESMFAFNPPKGFQKVTSVTEKAKGMMQAWSVGGPYADVTAVAKSQSVYASRPDRCDVLDHEGKTTRTFYLAENGLTAIRNARLPGGLEGLIAFRLWAPPVLATKTDGVRLWELTGTGTQSVDDVWAADLDGDGVDEVIVGYNGSTGLHVFSCEGKRLWKVTDLGNVWHVTAGDMDGGGKLSVVTTSATGKVHIFAPSNGKAVRILDAGLYAHMIRTAPGRSIPGAKGDIVLVVGISTGAAGAEMAALRADGNLLWKLAMPPGGSSCDSLCVSSDGLWAAVGLRGGKVCVVEIAKGRIVAQVGGQGMIPMVAWNTPTDKSMPLLLVATGQAVNAFRVKPAAAPAENARP